MPMAYIDIIIFAIIAAFLFFKLKNTLGTRHGEEKERKTIFDTTANPSQNNPLKKEESAADLNPVMISGSPALTQIALKDPHFDENNFTQGAKMAFTSIVESFANGDIETLEPLLSPELTDSFENIIRQRQEKGHHHYTDIIQVKKAEIIDSSLQGNLAKITVSFEAEESRYVKDNNGVLIYGDPDQITVIHDIWTFQKDLKINNPNWILIKTQSKTNEN